MGNIKILSNEIIDQIAAGEIVEGPSSALKEIVENSIDANSKSIDVFLKDGGRSKIVVEDNGDGMSKEDLEMCILRHATSKLSGNNLFDIHSYGFRGEAVPSIASVSDFSIESNGFGISVKFSEKSEIFKSNISSGTRVSISDIFHNLPARLKFLKTETVEMNKCIDVVENFALTRTDINFSLRNESKHLLSFNQSSIESRAREIYGSALVDKAVYFEENNDKISIKGYLFHSHHSRHNSYGAQRLFVNNRIVKSKLVNVASKVAYRNIIDPRRYPLTLLYIDIDPFFIDINVSPTKSEIRFRDESSVQKFIIHAISKNISEFNKIALDFPVFIPQNTEKIEPKYIPKVHRPPIDFGTINVPQIGNVPQIEVPESTKQEEFFQSSPEKEKFFGRAIIQLFDTYIISHNENTGDIFIIDQHAVHEKITLNKIQEQLNDGNAKHLMRPEIINLSEEQLNWLENNKEGLEKHGFRLDIIKSSERTAVGGTTASVVENSGASVIVNAIPGIMTSEEAFQFVIDISNDRNDECEMEEYIRNRLADVACHNSIRAGRKLSIPEMNEMLEEMEETKDVFQCNHHRPSFLKISRSDLEKMFERK
ncbi:MAG: DNA mismatch repair endonuclease MutL [Holosporales bacterium]|jgi:DNA mismatch repair protein MutL|nr:DNA mismatch repair endonuclease MutL [Holosporales bacterium]